MKYFFIVFLLITVPAVIILAQYGGSPPEISNVKITEVTENSATIEWETDKLTDATINYGLNDSYGIVRYPYYDRKNHKLVIDDLDSSTTYHFRIVSSDDGGNRSTSAGFVFVTKGVFEGEGLDIDEQDLVLTEKALALIEQVDDPEALELLLEKIQEQAGEQVGGPAIIGEPIVYADFDSAEIIWDTDKLSSSMVSFVPEAEYNPNSSDPYVFFQGDPNDQVLEHRVTIVGLEPSTLYHYQVVSEDAFGLEGRSRDFTFRTKSVLPEISNVRILKVQETTATIAWITAVPASGVVEYTNLRTNESNLKGDPTMTSSHNIQLQGLEFGTRYSVVVKSKNEAGDEAISDPISFITVKDEVAPIISKVSTESTLFPGDEVKIQTIVAWVTDEPAICRFFYAQGLAGGNEDEDQSVQEELNPVVEHVQVVVGLAPSTVYRFWVECRDRADNEARSEDFVLYTPEKEKSIIDLILENFEGTFGWLKNISN